jgi:hypothetical protein
MGARNAPYEYGAAPARFASMATTGLPRRRPGIDGHREGTVDTRPSSSGGEAVRNRLSKVVKIYRYFGTHILTTRGLVGKILAIVLALFDISLPSTERCKTNSVEEVAGFFNSAAT